MNPPQSSLHRTFQIILASAVSGVSHTFIDATFCQLLSSHADLLMPLPTMAGDRLTLLLSTFLIENIYRGLERGGISYLASCLTSIKENLIVFTAVLADFQLASHSCNCPPRSATCSLSVFTSARGRRLTNVYLHFLSHQKSSLLLYHKPHQVSLFKTLLKNNLQEDFSASLSDYKLLLLPSQHFYIDLYNFIGQEYIHLWLFLALLLSPSSTRFSQTKSYKKPTSRQSLQVNARWF